MSREMVDRRGLTVIHGGNEMPIVRQVDLPDDVLGIKKTENPLPNLLPRESISTRKPENHETLNIAEADIFHIKLELTNPFTTSFGTIKDKDVVLVFLKTADGITGIGECSVNPNPDYNEESTQTVLTVLDKHLLPRINIKQNINNVEDLLAIYGGVKGNFAAKTGIESAYWDLLSKRDGIPLHKYWGGGRDRVLTGVSIGGEDIDTTLRRVDKAVDMGFQRVKLKIRPGNDIQLIHAVRSRYPDLPLQVDANAAYSIDETDVFLKMDRYGLMLIEQPFSSTDLLDHARLQSQIDTPICLDESVRDYTTVRHAVELWSHIGKLDRLVINIKPPRMGGYWQAVKTADLCIDAGVRAFCGGMLDTSWTKLMNIQLSSHLAFVLPGDHAQQERYYTEDIAEPPLVNSSGVIRVSQLPQGSTSIKMRSIERNTVESKTYSFR